MSPLTNHDKRLYCLCGLPLEIDGIKIPPITIKRIVEKGESLYNTYLMFVVALKEAFKHIAKEIDTEELDKISDFDLIILLSELHLDFCHQISEAINFFINEKVVFNKTNKAFFVYDKDDNKIGQLDETNYSDFINIIKLQNNCQDAIDKQPEPTNAKIKAALKQREEARAKLRKAKNQSEENLTYFDYISILTSKSLEMDIEKCLNMTAFAFFNYMERLLMIDSYEIGIQQLMAGAKPNQVNLKHWFGSLQNRE